MKSKPRLVIPIARLAESVGLNRPPAPAPMPTTGAQTAGAGHGNKGRSARTPPDVGQIVHCLEYTDPTFRDPENGEMVVGLYREDVGTAAAVLLWADTSADLFRDASTMQYVRPPKFYMRLSVQPQIDPVSGYPIIDGAICPF